MIDGGYLAWRYGVKPGYGSWFQVRFQHADAVMILDAHPTWREVNYPSYKLKRKIKKAKFRELAEKAERVDGFIDLLREDPVLQTIWGEGCEADDLMALYLLRGGLTSLIGVDKDYFQIPAAWTAPWDPVIPDVQEKCEKMFPQFACPVPDAEMLLFNMLLFGDKSDSIPRILPSRDFDLYQRLRESESPIEACYDQFGQKVVDSLRLLLLPGVFLLREPLLGQGDQLVQAVVTRTYWNPDNFLLPVMHSSRIIEDDQEGGDTW